jgi:hypothetical protein
MVIAGYFAATITPTGVAMAGRQLTPTQRNRFAAGAAILLMAAWHTGPAFASANSADICDDAPNPSFEISGSQLGAIKISHEIDASRAETTKSNNDADALSPAKYLSPKAEAELRKVFEKSTKPAADSPIAETRLADGDEQPAVKARVPGVSDNDLARYKRQMYRRDI